MRIATWNVNSLGARMPRLKLWLASAEPDVLVLQETKLADEAFPTAELAKLGYASAHRGEGRWNGVAVLSRVGLSDVETDLPAAPGWPAPDGPREARYIAATCGSLRVAGVYVPNGRAVADPHYSYKLEWLRTLSAHLAPAAAGTAPFAVAGDFNVAPTDADVWDPAAFIGSTHVTEQERAALGQLRSRGLFDIVPTISKGPVFTYWDYRAGSFHKGFGMRIDLVYGNAAFRDRVRGAQVDREARKVGVKGTPAPSDHAPILVELQD